MSSGALLRSLSAHIRDDAIAAEIVAAKHDINARLKCIFAPDGRSSTILLSSFPDIDDHLPCLKALFQQPASLYTWCVPKNQVHKAVALL